MGKANAAAVAAKAIAAVAEGHTYAEMDCQAFVEYVVNACGGAIAFTGSNDMARNALSGLWPLAQAKAGGQLKPGAVLFIHDADGGEPQRYKADGLGNYSHIGFYVGAGALADTDRNGKRRVCDCVHSSASMGRVAGSTLNNGWTHAGWLNAVAPGDELTPGDSAAQSKSNCETDASEQALAASAASLAGAADEPSAAETLMTTLGLPAKGEAPSRYYTVRLGCKGGAVRRLQRWLAALDCDLGACGQDGSFGADTEKAVQAFQQQQGLTVDGTVGPRTWAALADACRQRMLERATAAAT